MRKKRGRKREKVGKEIVVLLVIISILVLAAALYLAQPTSQEKKPAEEYFRVFDATVDDAEPIKNDTVAVIWMIYGISFKLQVVGGDAHSLVVQSWAWAEPVYVGDVSKGDSRYVSQASPHPYGYRSIINEDGKFPMTIRITSVEAEGKITIYF